MELRGGGHQLELEGDADRAVVAALQSGMDLGRNHLVGEILRHEEVVDARALLARARESVWTKINGCNDVVNDDNN